MKDYRMLINLPDPRLLAGHRSLAVQVNLPRAQIHGRLYSRADIRVLPGSD
jgi:hypothetical protein